MSSPQGSLRIAMRDVYYNEHCWIQAAAMRAGLDMIPSFANRDKVVAIDYGCSQGANSIEPLQKTIASLPDGAIAHLLFEDTPFNDFSSLAQTISRHFAPSAEHRLSIFTGMIPIGFFEQVVPDGFADIGFSWSSMNYLSRIPDISLDATASPADFVAARHKALAAAGHSDLVKLLRQRAREIRPGGYFVAAIGGQRPAGEPDRPLTNTGFQPLQGALMKMVASGTLKKEELMGLALFPSTERTVEEVRASLNETTSLWEVETLEPKLIEHPAWATYQAALKTGDKKEEATREYAFAVVVNLVSSSGWFWIDTLKKTRGEDWTGGDAFLAELTRLAVDVCIQEFHDMRVEIWYNYVRLRRTDGKVVGE